MQTTRTNLAAVATLLLAAALGCGESHGLVPVSGTVTIDGQPLTTGQVMVSPPGQRQSIGPLDGQGRFELTCYKKGDGAPVGTFPVAVMAVEQVGERQLRWHAPRKYSNEQQSGLEVTIDGATDDLAIELTWQGSNHSGPFDEKF